MPGPDEQLSEIERAGLLRRCRTLDSPTGVRVTRDGRELWNFASNDYLGLADHPHLREAFHEGLDRWGHGAAASRLITGSQPPHAAFEEQLAAAKGCEAALSFSSGWALATGVIPALVGQGDFVVLDKLAHASLIDGARLSGATLRVFPHNRADRLDALLASIRAKHSTARLLVITESVFSMDGDLCPLREIVACKDRHGALLLLDEAHGFGVLGPTGMGLAEELALQDRVDFSMGTLGKAAGLAGAYLASSAAWRDLLVNRARSFLFSTAPPPALAHAASAALERIRSAEGSELRERLQQNIALLGGDRTPILPRILGANEAALEASAALEQAGFLVPAIRYPTVAKGSARLRVSLSATHPPAAIEQLTQHLPRHRTA